MRLLVISDVHANARALEKVLAHADSQGWDEVVFLGDAVGYGHEALETVERLRSLPLRAGVLGNHEAMLAELRSGRRPNAASAVTEVLSQNLSELGAKDLDFLDGLEPVHLEPADQQRSWGAVHGALRTPFEYLISVPAARANASHMERDVYFLGHTHVPAAFVQEADGKWLPRSFNSSEGVVKVGSGSRAFLNPGSVSMPRDRVPGYSYAIFDEETGEFAVYRFE